MTKEIQKAISAEELAMLKDSYPVEQGLSRIMLPRLEFVSQDQTEGKGKSMKVTVEAGTFFTSSQSDEVDEDGKKVWAKDEIGKEVSVIILYERKQLKFYDGEGYVSSPIYDTDDQVIPLFKDKTEIDRGTPAELKSRSQYQGKSAKGKDISKLEENKVLYVLYKDELYQLSIRGTSMYAFRDYKKTVTPNAVVTTLNSVPKENGSTAWNQITYTEDRTINSTELPLVMESIAKIKTAVEMEKAYYGEKAPSQVDKDFDAIGKVEAPKGF
jgi:hypothetical protein